MPIQYVMLLGNELPDWSLFKLRKCNRRFGVDHWSRFKDISTQVHSIQNRMWEFGAPSALWVNPLGKRSRMEWRGAVPSITGNQSMKQSDRVEVCGARRDFARLWVITPSRTVRVWLMTWYESRERHDWRQALVSGGGGGGIQKHNWQKSHTSKKEDQIQVLLIKLMLWIAKMSYQWKR